MSDRLDIPDWTTFKSVCIVTKNLNCQYADSGFRYDIYGPDANGITWHTTIAKVTNPATTSDQYDFETNYMPQFNRAIGTRLSPNTTMDVAADDDALSGVLTKASIVGTPVSTSIWLQFDHENYVSGAQYWSVGAQAGDYVTANIVDKDGVITDPATGTTYPAGTVLMSYILKRFLNPVDNSVQELKRAYWAYPPVGCYICITGVIANVTSDVSLYCNIYKHRPLYV